MKPNYLIAGLALTLSLTANADPITVATYSMVDGAPNNLYYDNTYTGSNNAGFLSGGKGDLTDGTLTASVALGYDHWAPYVLWDGKSPVITFDLGDEYTLNSVTGYFKFYASAAVYLPSSVGLRFSNDGVNFSFAQLRPFSAAERSSGADDSNGIFELLPTIASARYVELTLNDGPENRWIALSEVTFDGSLGGTANVSEPSCYFLTLFALGALGLRQMRNYP
ncbi:MAG: discoidin domain-containing protein [Methylococcales bacterium]|nr:discoidin domain-containing protein [Methylococcales bacterium]